MSEDGMGREHPVTDSEIRFGLDRHTLKGVEPPRPLNDWELSVFDRLLSVPFDGRDEVHGQLAVARVQSESFLAFPDPTLMEIIFRD